MNNRLGVDWLKANDPKYVSPQKKGAATRATPVDPARLGELLAGTGTIRVGGTWKQRTPIGFSGDGEDYSVEVIDNKTNPDRIVTLSSTHVGRQESTSKRNGSAKRKARRAKRKQQTRG